MLLNTIEGVRSTDSVMTETARSFAAHPVASGCGTSCSPRRARGSWRASGRRLSVALILMVISEMFASSSGLGYRIVYFQRNYLIAEMWSGILLLGLDRRAARRDLQRSPRGACCAGTTESRRSNVPDDTCCRSSTCRRSTSPRRATSRRSATSASRWAPASWSASSVRPGCGKTTLLKCIAGLLRPTQGIVEIDGKPVTGPPPNMALVFQEYGRSLYPWLTVRGNVELPLQAQEAARAPSATGSSTTPSTAVGLEHAAKSYPWQLSGGMQQRVAIARAIAYQPEVLIMDEPFAAVDAQTRADLEDLVRELHLERGMSILFVTHDIDESVYLGERVLVLSKSPTWVQEDLAIDLAAGARPDHDARSAPLHRTAHARLRADPARQARRGRRGRPRERSPTTDRRRGRACAAVSRSSCCSRSSASTSSTRTCRRSGRAR